MAKKTVDSFKAKQARQKKIVIGGSVLLLLLLAVQGPKMLKRLKGDEDVPAWLAASRQGATAAPAPAADGSLAAPSLAGGNPTGATAPTTGSSGLVADPAPTAGPGQLASFSRFESKDPFAAQVSAAKSGSTVPEPPTPPSAGKDAGDDAFPTTPGGSKDGGGTKSGGGTAAPPAASPTSAVIAVNGVLGSVTVGSDFAAGPNSEPLFHLVSLTAKTAKVSVAGGSYANGAAAITLHVRKSVTLMNTADGTRYKLELYPQGTAVPATGTTGATTTAAAPAGTTTTTTTAP